MTHPATSPTKGETGGAEVPEKFDPCVTPVWALYGSSDDAEIICAPLLSYERKRRSPVPRSAMWGEGGIWTSRSSWHRTEAELIEKEGIMPSCSSCQRPFATKSWVDPYPKVLRETNTCFHCHHWKQTIERFARKEAGLLVIEGTIYSYDVERPIVKITNGGGGYGHGGREFRIRLNSGEGVTTNNLWCGGQIPKRFRAQLPDTASFEKTPAPIGHGQGFLS